MMLDGVEAWSPPTGDLVELVAAGRAWDAVRVPTRIGLGALTRIGDDSGAVIQDTAAGGLVWLVRPGAADTWKLPQPFMHIHGARHYVWVPPVDRTREHHCLRWIVPLTRTCYLTDPEPLHTALTAEIEATSGPHIATALLPCDPCLTAAIYDDGTHNCQGTSSMAVDRDLEMVPVPPEPCPCNHQPPQP